MGGKYSKDKGRRNEYLLRDSLRGEGFEADRVPLSGASPNHKGDIAFRKDGQEWKAEAKLRGGSTFDRIYNLFSAYAKEGSFSVAVGDDDLHLFSIHDSMAKAVAGPLVYPPLPSLKESKELTKGVNYVINIKKMMQDCDFLVIRSDRKPFLYIRYR